MEFKLNKIDTDIRKKMQENTKADKVHGLKEEDGITKFKGYDEHEDKDNNNEQRKNKRKRYITIDGMKYETPTVNVQAEKLGTINEENSKGRILDAKK